MRAIDTYSPASKLTAVVAFAVQAERHELGNFLGITSHKTYLIRLLHTKQLRQCKKTLMSLQHAYAAARMQEIRESSYNVHMFSFKTITIGFEPAQVRVPARNKSGDLRSPTTSFMQKRSIRRSLLA